METNRTDSVFGRIDPDEVWGPELSRPGTARSLADGLVPVEASRGPGQSGPRRVLESPSTDRSDQGRVRRVKALSPAEQAFVRDLALWGPISDELLGGLRAATAAPTQSRDAIRKQVRNTRRHGLVDAFPVLLGGGKARHATEAGAALARVNSGGEVADWSRLEVSQHLLGLDAAVQVLPLGCSKIEARRVMLAREVQEAHEGTPHRVTKRFQVPGVGTQEWTPVLSFVGESEVWCGVYVLLDRVPDVALRFVLPRLGYVDQPVVVATFEPTIEDDLKRVVAELGLDSWCAVRLCQSSLRLED